LLIIRALRKAPLVDLTLAGDEKKTMKIIINAYYSLAINQIYRFQRRSLDAKR
jgi:hypothetical protein